jgi:hypothetical protein
MVSSNANAKYCEYTVPYESGHWSVITQRRGSMWGAVSRKKNVTLCWIAILSSPGVFVNRTLTLYRYLRRRYSLIAFLM